MRVLAISTWFPFPPDNGSKARAYHLLRHLGARHELDLLALSQSESDHRFLEDVRRFCRRVETFPEPMFRPSSLSNWAGFLSPTPRYFLAHHSPDLADHVARWTEERSYHAAIAVTLGAAPYAAGLDGPRLVLDEHNVESQVIRRQWRQERAPFRKLRLTPTWIKAERFERSLAGKFDAVAVVSEQERRLLAELMGNGHAGHIHVVPNGVDPALLDYKGPPRERNRLIYTGALTYSANHDAAQVLCRDILPLVRRRVPDAHVGITGRSDGVRASELSQPGVELTGYVPDLRPVVASASVLVSPLRFGGGTRLKILEAMALGTPVVSTSVGAEGLRVTDGVNILLAETPEDIAERVGDILLDPELAEGIAANARELVREHYQWPAIAEEFERVVGGER